MIIALIPARYQSSRLPGKPLLKFGKHTMIQKVYLQTIKSKYIDKAFVLTDDIRVKKSINEINGNTIMITDECINGTERICIAILKYPEIFNKCKYIVNIQGDEPFTNPLNIDLITKKMIDNKDSNIKCSTLCYKITKKEELFNTSIGKVVLDSNNNILYCSRNCIPANKNNKYDLSKQTFYAHMGLFIFDLEYLKNHYMKKNTPLQIFEDIEWLKILEQGFKIKASIVTDYEIGVNLIEDYNYLIKKYYL